MSQDAENLLEHDRIEEVLEAADPPGPSQPVVMIEHSHKGLTWYLLLALTVLVTIGGLWLYHKRQLNDLETQARYTKRELDRLKAQSLNEPLPGEIALATRKTPTPPTSSAQPDNSNAAPAPAAPSTVPESAPTATTAMAIPPKDAQPSPPVANSQPAPTPPPQTPLLAPVASPAMALEPSQPSVGALIGGTPVIAPSSLASTQPRVEAPSGASAPPPVIEPGQAPESVAVASSPAEVIPAAAPLPSKEEAIRQIEEEAAQKADELRRQTLDQQVEIRRLRNEERVRFHEELRDAIKRNGLRAGPAIDQLCDRYGYDTDGVRFGKAARVWAMTDKSLAYRVGRIRALDLPETVILNFLSDDLHARLRTPGGPRDKNEVRVKAATKLLACDPRANEQAAAVRTSTRGDADESPSPRKARTP